MSEREPKKAMLGTPTIMDAAVKKRASNTHRKAALDLRNTIKATGKYLVAIFPIDEDGTLVPVWGLHWVGLDDAHMPEVVAMFKEKMQEKLAARRKPDDDGKGTLEILDEVVAEHTPAEMTEDADDAEPVDPAE